MGVVVCCKCLGVVTLIFLCGEFFAVAQEGFVSIDCGGQMNRRDPETNISWVTDDQFMNGGKTAYVNDTSLPFYLQTQRIFPKPVNKSCYQLTLTPKVPHLLRIWIVGRTYSQDILEFNYSIETREMLALRSTTIQVNPPSPSEKILISNGSELYICLIRKSQHVDPFISAIELRRLKLGMYNVTPEKMWSQQARYDAGSTSTVRYPDDQFDRIWSPFTKYNVKGADDVSLQKPVEINDTIDLPPTTVMQTALVSNPNTTIEGRMDISMNPPIPHDSLFLLYFAEIKEFSMSESRNFNIFINYNQTPLTTVRLPEKLSAVERQFVFPQVVYLITLLPNFGGRTMINALEIYNPIPTAAFTFGGDVQAMNVLKQRVNFSNWVSDPCFGFPWDGIDCNNSTSAVRVSGMLLNNNHLTGVLPNLSNLKKLERLHLQNNNLSGPVPDWLTGMSNLKELFIQNNSFSGAIPRQLLNPSLNLVYSGNPLLHRPPSNRRQVGIIVGAIVGGVVVLALALVAAFLAYRRKFRKKEIVKTKTQGSGTPKEYTTVHGEDYSMVLVPNPTKSRAFTLEELLTATENFTNKIGQGGFGSVYLGKLQEGKQIAVKVLSSFSKQGVVEFLNEIDLLSKINHKNLVSLLGYCNESRELMLVYDWMPGGSLRDQLYGRYAGEYPNLDWKTRLQIVLDAAQGLEYLHVSCTPKIIHRDVKSANILLDANLNAKLADFGLSRVTIDRDASHITTTVKGTAGYLDPEYCNTQMLTEKSDVYSFGVVLLEIICGRRPINFSLSEEEMNLVRWVTPYVKGDEDLRKIPKIIDKRLGDGYDTKSIVHVARMALRCVESHPSIRPSISDVVMEIKEAMKYQNEATRLNEVSKDTYVEQGKSQNNKISLIDSTGRKEMGSSANSCSFTLEGR
uniref:Protein kinase domain-containing protein n=1 Tax=Araucaria cunninghamii TaxID=56994 RepID=A0A0D6QTN4_ARACU